MSTDRSIESARVIRERLAVAAGAALLVAGLLLVVAVLPAEFGIDPTGAGRLLGLTAMHDVKAGVEAFASAQGTAVGATTVVSPGTGEYRNERVQFVIGPRDFIEYKYRLDKGNALLYAWTASAPVNYELHAEPDGAPQGYAQSYEKKNGSSGASGTLTTQFSGIHGWYWENTTDQPVTVTLSAAGFYRMSHEFRKGAAPKTRTFE
jgi:hypothetical protein